MRITKEMRKYAAQWLEQYNIACENGVNPDMGSRVKNWFFHSLLGEQSPKMTLDVLRYSVHDEISKMVDDELGEVIEDLKRL